MGVSPPLAVAVAQMPVGVARAMAMASEVSVAVGFARRIRVVVCLAFALASDTAGSVSVAGLLRFTVAGAGLGSSVTWEVVLALTATAHGVEFVVSSSHIHRVVRPHCWRTEHPAGVGGTATTARFVAPL